MRTVAVGLGDPKYENLPVVFADSPLALTYWSFGLFSWVLTFLVLVQEVKQSVSVTLCLTRHCYLLSF